jgi:3-phenylpropionate/trans-cinnamate dioxygenase ferredoxin component
MPEFVYVATLDALPQGSARAFPVGRYEVALFNIGGELYALENACPHQGGPIADGWIEGKTVTCPWHAWCFDLQTGKMTLGDFASIPRFDVRIEGDDVYIATEPLPS